MLAFLLIRGDDGKIAINKECFSVPLDYTINASYVQGMYAEKLDT